MSAVLLALALSLPAAAAPSFPDLAKVRGWPIYDERAAGATDLGDVCRMARLPCGVIAPKGEALAAPEGPIAGRTAGELLDRVLAAHPGYAAELIDGVLVVRRPADACAAALERPARAADLPAMSGRVAALRILLGSGWPAPAKAGLASLAGEAEDARYLPVQVLVHKGASVRRALDAIARADGRMLWAAESDGKACTGFRFRNWRAPQAVSTSASTFVSVEGAPRRQKPR